jgi:hypothetical protein
MSQGTTLVVPIERIALPGFNPCISACEEILPEPGS